MAPWSNFASARICGRGISLLSISSVVGLLTAACEALVLFATRIYSYGICAGVLGPIPEIGCDVAEGLECRRKRLVQLDQFGLAHNETPFGLEN